MAWVRLDDKFWRNEKMRRLSHAARGVFCDSLSYCADTPEPTGFLTFTEARQRGPQRLISELATNGNFETITDGYLIHDFEKYIERGSRERCKAWRDKKRESSSKLPESASHEQFANGSRTAPRATGLETISTSGFYPNPSRPVPEGVKPLQNGIPEISMHVGGLHPISKILDGLRLQSRKEAI